MEFISISYLQTNLHVRRACLTNFQQGVPEHMLNILTLFTKSLSFFVDLRVSNIFIQLVYHWELNLVALQTKMQKISTLCKLLLLQLSSYETSPMHL